MALSSVIVFIVDIQYFAVLDLERQPPVARDVETPDSLAVSGELVGFPQWESTQFFRVMHVLQKSQHCAELVHDIGRQTFRAVLQVEPSQALVDEAPYLHSLYRSPLPYTCQFAGRQSTPGPRTPEPRPSI